MTTNSDTILTDLSKEVVSALEDYIQSRAFTSLLITKPDDNGVVFVMDFPQREKELLQSITAKWKFKDEQSALKFMLSVFSLHDHRAICIESGDLTRMLHPSPLLLADFECPDEWTPDNMVIDVVVPE